MRSSQTLSIPGRQYTVYPINSMCKVNPFLTNRKEILKSFMLFFFPERAMLLLGVAIRVDRSAPVAYLIYL